mgnify:CR=1 FL=1
MLMQMALLFGFGQAYHVGDLYVAPDGSQGVVFFVHADGGGWAVALQDEDNILPWSTTAVDVPALTNYGAPFAQAPVADTSGYANTQTIRNYLGASNNYAAGAVDFDHGWYVPAMAQLCLIYAQLPLIQAALILVGGTPLDISYDPYNTSGQNSAYWSSTEANSEYAWFMIFYDDTNLSNSYSDHTGTPMKTPKNQSNYRVRAVCSFPPRENVYDSTLTYLWNTGSTEPHFHDVPLQNTTYIVTVSNAYGCTNTDSADVMVIDNNPQTFYDTVCQGSTYNNHGFALSAQETAEVGEIVRTQTLSAVGCESEITLFLTVVPHDIVYLEQTATDSLVWNGVTYTEDGTYTQYFNNQYGCDSTVILTLTLEGGGGPGPGPEPDTIPFGEGDTLMLYLPNAITPTRNDGLNDYFSIPEGFKSLISIFEIKIYNRWGTMVYHATDKNFRWDGRINGTIYFNVVYNYMIFFEDIIGRPYILSGTITVL